MHASQETTGAPVGGPYTWGLCFPEEGNGLVGSNYCVASAAYPCAAGKSYHGEELAQGGGHLGRLQGRWRGLGAGGRTG